MFVRCRADTERVPGGKMPAAALRLAAIRWVPNRFSLLEVLHKNDVTT